SRAQRRARKAGSVRTVSSDGGQQTYCRVPVPLRECILAPILPATDNATPTASIASTNRATYVQAGRDTAGHSRPTTSHVIMVASATPKACAKIGTWPLTPPSVSNDIRSANTSQTSVRQANVAATIVTEYRLPLANNRSIRLR